MAKMWAVAVAFAIAVAWAAMLGSCTQVHFSSTHKDCGNKTISIIHECIKLYIDAERYNYDEKLYCIHIRNATACLETAQCHCEYTEEQAHQAHLEIAWFTYLYNNKTKCNNMTKGNDKTEHGDAEDGESTDSDVFGPIELTHGINCSEHNKTAGNITLLLATANDSAVKAIAEQCDPMLDCYRQYDSEAVLYLNGQDLHTTCMAIGKLMECIVNATCDCDLNKNETLKDWVSTEKDEYEYFCDIAIDFPYFEVSGIKCPGMRNCEYDYPMDHCLQQWHNAKVVPWERKKYCLAELDWARCIEKLACDCGFLNDTLYYRTLAASKDHYEDMCSQVINETGPFPNHTGINCTAEEDELLYIALEQIGFVRAEEERCPGIFQCYNDTIDELNEAYRSKNLTAMCQLDAERLYCLENTNCDCGFFWEPDVLEKMEDQTNELQYWCSGSKLESEYPLIICPNCVPPDEQNTCEEHLKAVYGAWSLVDYCRALYDLVVCTETVACDCGFYNESTYYHTLTIVKNVYNEYAGCYIFREFPSHKGLTCLPTNNVTGEVEQLVSVALADTEYVKAEDLNCSGIRQCYLAADDKFEEAYHNKSLSALCEAQAERILCVEQKYCKCGKISEDETMEKIIDKRREHHDLCEFVTGKMSVEQCRDEDMCGVEEPLVVCDMKYDMEFDAAYSSVEQCRAHKHYLLCIEEVGCMCGLLANGSSEVAIAIHSFTMYGRQFYTDVSCHTKEAFDPPDKEGIQCQNQTDDVLRKLVLAYADSSEAAAHVGECYRVHKCLRNDDKTRAAALYSRNNTEYCKVGRDLVHCLDEAYCLCGLNGTRDAEVYMSQQLSFHCEKDVDDITRKECVSLIGNLERNCSDFKDCRVGVDDRLADALVEAIANKSYTEFCDEKKKLIECADKAFCNCKLNGNDDAKDYRKMQVSYHSEYCTPAIGNAKKCEEATEAAGDLRSSALLIILIFLAGLYGPSWMLGTAY